MLNENIALVPVDEADEALVEGGTLEELLPPAPVLITEQEVVLGTAVALQAPTTRRRWRQSVHVMLAAIQRPAAPSAPAERRPRNGYPRRYAFLDNSCMAREMGRL